MSEILSPPELQMESLARYLVGCIFSVPDEIAYSLSISFLIHFGRV